MIPTPTDHDRSPVIARAPLRISFAGGGTDLPAYYEHYAGAVLSTTITPSVYAIITPSDDERTHITSTNGHAAHTNGAHHGHNGRSGELTLLWAVARTMGLGPGARVTLTSDVPSGTGLGSSSATAVALIMAIAAWQRRTFTSIEAAELAAHIEIDLLGQPIGKQDQYAAAFGNINLFSFSQDGVTVTPVNVAPAIREELEAYLALYFTGSRRQAGAILEEQRFRTAHSETQTIESLHAIKAKVNPMRAALESGDFAAMGALLDESWQLKRQVSSGITTNAIDEAYHAARGAGALGGKICGAGGGGFLLLLTPPALQSRVQAALQPLGLQHLAVTLEERGAELTAYDERNQLLAHLLAAEASDTLPVR